MAGTSFANGSHPTFCPIHGSPVSFRLDPMPGDSFWMCVDVLASALGGSREEAEHALARLERDILARPRAERDELRQKIILIVAALSRLEVRLRSTEGPSTAAI